MTLFILAYIGGVFTIVSPCILPVLPFVLARAGKPFQNNGLPLLLGIALAFTAVASLAAVGGAWAVQLNTCGRWLAIGLLVFFALALLFPALADWLARPWVALGAKISLANGQRASGGSFLSSVVLGAATGLLWAPCAGPILGLILIGAAIGGPSAGTSALLLAYAAGAATSLALALLLGGRVHAFMQRSLSASQWLRRAMGALVLAGVAMIATGLDTGLLSRLSLAGTSAVEQKLIDTLRPSADNVAGGDAVLTVSTQGTAAATKTARPAERAAAVEGRFSSFELATGWVNTTALNGEALRGKVVLVDFWTYSCINCLRTLPYIRAWADKYRDAGLVVVGVHSPEFAFEKNPDNVRRAVKDLGISYPVAIDSKHAIWRAFQNQYWPALYFVDAKGRIRHHVFGEGRYEEAERVIQKLLAENGSAAFPGGLASVASVDAPGTQAAPGDGALSGESYLGHDRAANFVPRGGIKADRARTYEPEGKLNLNQWTLGGTWSVEAERAVADTGARLAYRFQARDLHLVLGRDGSGRPVRFRVRIDGQAPSGSHGTDVDAEGNGLIDAHRLYQLVRQTSSRERLFEIEFLDPGAHVYAFTFG